MRNRTAIAGILAFTIGCTEDTPAPTRASPSALALSATLGATLGAMRTGDPVAAAAANFPRGRGPSDRKASPWRKLSDDALANAVVGRAGEVMIGFKDSEASDGVDNYGRVMASVAAVGRGRAFLASVGAAVDYEFPSFPVVHARVSRALVAAIRHHPNIDYIEPVTTFRTTQAPSTPAQFIPGAVTQINVPSVWPAASGSGVKVLVLDTGVPSSHQDLNTAVAFRCIDGTTSVYDFDGHGTQMSGIIKATNNSVDIIGVAYNVQLWSANVAASESNHGQLSNAEIACAINIGRINGVGVINMSFTGIYDTPTVDQIHAAYYQNDIVLIAGNGNDYMAQVGYPANLPEVIAVAAVDGSNAHVGYSNTGPETELSAPGDGVGVVSLARPGYGAYPWYDLTYSGGTSAATAYVSGVAALVRSYNPSWNNAYVRRRLRETTTYLGTPYSFGNGLINGYQAVTAYVCQTCY